MIFLEKWLRRIIKDELQQFMEAPQNAPQSYSVKSLAGGELIIPNPVRQAFDEGKVKSMGDILI